MFESEYSITIGIPTFNGAGTIESCLQSCLNAISFSQREDVEILIQDNCSTDSTDQIVEKIMKENPNFIRYIKNQNNIGLDRNIDELVRNSRGRYVKLLGDDDLLYEDFLVYLVEVLENSKTDLVLNAYNAVGEIRTNDTADQSPRVYSKSYKLFEDSNGIVGQIASITYNRESYLGVSCPEGAIGTNHKFMFVAMTLGLRGDAAYDKRISISVRPGSPRFTRFPLDSLNMQKNAYKAIVLLKQHGAPWDVSSRHFLRKLQLSQGKYSLTFMDFTHRYSTLNSFQVIKEFFSLGKCHAAFYLKYVPIVLIPKFLGNKFNQMRKNYLSKRERNSR